MKWWTKCISMVIAKTASRNVAFKSDKIKGMSRRFYAYFYPSDFSYT